MPSKRALLIGINAYPHVSPLNGCVNDVRLMRSVLVDAYAFPAEQVTVLENDQATRAGILAAFDALVDATGADDIVVFHFAGHGSQIADREGDEPSGLDSTLVPFDAARPGGPVPDITDDEINLRLEALAARTRFITVLVDACHSGTITRDEFGEPARSIEPDTRPAAALPPSPIPPERRGARASGPSGWMPLTDKYVLIAGCRDDERSYEYRPPESGGAVVHGALTYFLCQQLRRGPGPATYRDVFERTATLVNAVHPLQHPQMEGRTDREVFGVAEFVPSTFVRVLERDGGHVLLAAGAAHGTTVGSRYRVFPPGTLVARADGWMAEIEVLEVQAVTALARIASEEPASPVVPDARAFEYRHAFGDQRLLVSVAPSDPPAETAALRARLAASRLLAVAGDAAQAVARIYRLAARDAVSAGSPVPQAGPLAAPCWAVVGASGDLLMPLRPIDEMDAVVENLERLATYRQALAIENPDPFSRLRDQFTLALQTLGPDRRTWTTAAAAPDRGQIVVDEGAIIRVVMTSLHDAPVFVSLYDFGLSGAISQIYPARGAQEMLRPRGELACRPQRLVFPAAYPLGGAVAGVSASEGLETIKLFVTEQATDFSAFEQEGLRLDVSSPLGGLLASVFNGRTTRDAVPVSFDDEDWTTVSLSFVLRRLVKEA